MLIYALLLWQGSPAGDTPADPELYVPARFRLDDPTVSFDLDDPRVTFTLISAGRIMATRNYKIRPQDDGRTYRGPMKHAGFKNLANLDGYTLFGAFVNVETEARTYDNLAGTIVSFDPTEGEAEVEFVSPPAPMTAGKYRLEPTLVSPSGKQITAPSPEMPQTFITVVDRG